MVKLRTALLAMLLILFVEGWGADVSVTSEIDGDTLYENQPIRVLVTVTHPGDQTVDVGSFLLGSDPVAAEAIKEVRFSPENPLLLSFYRFQIPPKSSGRYLLPPVSVKVGGTLYRSISTNYEVKPGRTLTPSSRASIAPVPSPTTPEAASLKLEAFIEGSNTVYPGERFKGGYKYLFTGEIDLDKEDLPLLDGKGLIKIGEKEIVDSSEGESSVRLITQLFEAKTPGSYTFGPSVVEGYAYIETATGKKTYYKDKLISEAPAITVNVLPFPEQDKPASFSGAIGDFSFSTSLLSAPEMNVGDEFILELKVEGKGNLSTVAFHSLCCQPGFSGFFSISDLPPAEEVKGEVKTVRVKMRPMTDMVKEIPSIAFSFFDPVERRYGVRRSAAIPITINPAKLAAPQERSSLVAQKEKEEREPESKAQAQPIEIMGPLPLEADDLRNLHFGSWWSLALLPLSLFALLYQWRLKMYLDWKGARQRSVNSLSLFEKAFANRKKSRTWDQEQLKSAFRLALEEAGLVSYLQEDEESFAEKGIVREVQALLEELDERRFSGKGEIDAEEAYQKAKPLFDKIRHAGEVRSAEEAK